MSACNAVMIFLYSVPKSSVRTAFFLCGLTVSLIRKFEYNVLGGIAC